MLPTLLCATVALGACDGGGGDEAEITIDNVAEEMANAACEFQVRCGGSPDQATCLATTLAEDQTLLTLRAEAKAGRVTFDADAAQACIHALEDADCNLLVFFNVVTTSCDAVFKGAVAADGACFESDQCKDHGTCSLNDPDCDKDTTCCPGKCVAVKIDVAIDSECAEEDRCVKGAYCTEAGKCAAQATRAGDPCESFDACAEGLVCNLKFSTTDWTCYKPASGAEECDPNVFFGACAKSLQEYCDPATKRCLPRIAVGKSCAAEGSECALYADCDGSLCEEQPGKDEACTKTDRGDNCLGDLECVADKCTLPTLTACQ